LFSYYPRSLIGLSQSDYQIPPLLPISQSQLQLSQHHNIDLNQAHSISNNKVDIKSQLPLMAEVNKKESKDKDKNDKDKDTEVPIIIMEKALEQCESDVSFLNEILQDFLLDCKDRIPKLKTALIANDYKVYSHEAHSIKGAASNIALEGMEKASKSLEILGKACETSKENPKPGEKEELLKKLEHEYDRFCKFIEERSKTQGQ